MILYTQVIETEGDKRLFEEVYTAYCGRMLALARQKLSSAADAEDAVQQAFLSLAEQFSRLARLPRTQLEAYLVVAMGAVLAVSPQAQAAAKRWLMKITDVVTTYQFYPTAEETTPWDGLPQWTGEGYELTYDLQGDNGVRTLRYTSSQGDILLQRVTLYGTENTVEIRSRETDGFRDLQGQRPQGEEGAPKEYTMVQTRVGPYEGQRYEFHTGAGYGDSGGDFGIRFYRDGEWFHHVAVLQGATALIWTDEEAQELFLLIGTDADALQRMAESIY